MSSLFLWWKGVLMASQGQQSCVWVPEQCWEAQQLGNPFHKQKPGRFLKNTALLAAALQEMLYPELQENVVGKGDIQQLLIQLLSSQKEGTKISLPHSITLGNPSWISKNLSLDPPHITLIINAPGVSTWPPGSCFTWDPTGLILPVPMLLWFVVSLFAFEQFHPDGLSN